MHSANFALVSPGQWLDLKQGRIHVNKQPWKIMLSIQVSRNLTQFCQTRGARKSTAAYGVMFPTVITKVTSTKVTCSARDCVVITISAGFAKSAKHVRPRVPLASRLAHQLPIAQQARESERKYCDLVLCQHYSTSMRSETTSRIPLV